MASLKDSSPKDLYPEVIEISVPQTFIWGGVKANGHRCPVALTVKSMYPDDQVYVTPSTISIRGKILTSVTARYKYEFIQDGINFANRFDRGLDVEPGTFTAKRINDGIHVPCL